MLGEKKLESKFSKLTASIYRLFTTDAQIFDTVREGSVKEVQALLDKGININAPYAGTTFLLVSLTNRRFNTTLLLLERGADANASYKRGKIIQHAVNIGDASQVKLLTWYGANTQEVGFTKHPELKALMESLAKKVTQRKALEADLLIPSISHSRRKEIYGDLATLWGQQAVGETQPDYLTHYQQKSDCYQQAQRPSESNEIELASFTEEEQETPAFRKKLL